MKQRTCIPTGNYQECQGGYLVANGTNYTDVYYLNSTLENLINGNGLVSVFIIICTVNIIISTTNIDSCSIPIFFSSIKIVICLFFQNGSNATASSSATRRLGEGISWLVKHNLHYYKLLSIVISVHFDLIAIRQPNHLAYRLLTSKYPKNVFVISIILLYPVKRQIFLLKFYSLYLP